MEVNEFMKIADGEVFRTVTTMIDTISYEPMTFVCKKGSGNDWAIYYHYPDKTIPFICKVGMKVRDEAAIQSICPCSKEVLSLYRR